MPENRVRNFFISPLFLFGVFALTIFLLFIYGRASYQDYQIKQEISGMREEVKRLEAKKLESLEVLKYVKTGAFLEAKAHTDFNLVKPGENVTIINSNASEKSIGQSEKKVVESTDVPIYQRWWNYFFKH